METEFRIVFSQSFQFVLHDMVYAAFIFLDLENDFGFFICAFGGILVSFDMKSMRID